MGYRDSLSFKFILSCSNKILGFKLMAFFVLVWLKSGKNVSGIYKIIFTRLWSVFFKKIVIKSSNERIDREISVRAQADPVLYRGTLVKRKRNQLCYNIEPARACNLKKRPKHAARYLLFTSLLILCYFHLSIHCTYYM